MQPAAQLCRRGFYRWQRPVSLLRMVLSPMPWRPWGLSQDSWHLPKTSWHAACLSIPHNVLDSRCILH